MKDIIQNDESSKVKRKQLPIDTRNITSLIIKNTIFDNNIFPESMNLAYLISTMVIRSHKAQVSLKELSLRKNVYPTICL